MNKRRTITQLPAVHQTEPLSKLFASSVDPLFQPGQAENLSGYIGHRDLSYYDINKDFYIAETRPAREAHQLDVTMVSLGTGGGVDNALFYDDIVNYLRSQGALVADENRLFEGERYSWVPPVNIDKLMNFGEYLWFGDVADQPNLVLSAPRRTFVGDGATKTFALPEAAGMAVGDESVKVFVNGVLTPPQSRNTTTVTLASAPSVNATITVFRHGDLRRALFGKSNPAIAGLNEHGVAHLTAGMRITLVDGLSHSGEWDQNTDLAAAGWDTTPWDSAPPNDFYVEDVAAGVRLLDFNTFTTLSDPTYVVMDRACRDQNRWAVLNRWVHKDTVSWLATSYAERRARRPIIEFNRDLKLWNYGRRRLADIQATSGQLATFQAGWDTTAWDLGVFEGGTLPFLSINGALVGTLMADPQAWDPIDPATNRSRPMPLVEGQRIIILGVSDNVLGNAVYRVRVVTDPVDGASRYLLVAEDDAVLGDIVRLPAQTATTQDREFHFDGDTWVEAQARLERSGNYLAAPLFELYDEDGVSLADESRYPNALKPFVGNRLFSYSESNAAPLDPVLDMGLERNSDGDILFEVNAVTNRQTTLKDGTETEVTGYYYHRILADNPEDDVYQNNWIPVQPGTPVTTRRPTVRYYTYQGGRAAFSFPATFSGAPLDVRVAGVTIDPALYVVTATQVTLRTAPAVGARVEILLYGIGDVYEVPLNLRANPGNNEVAKISRGQWYDHFSSLMLAQPGFSGQPFSANNWRDIPHDLSLGQKILQHRTPLLKTMLLASDARFDLPTAIQTAETEYTRFRARFLTRVLDLTRQGDIRPGTSDAEWAAAVETVLVSLRQNKSADFPFAVSGVAGEGYFVPSTPAALGVLPVHQPALLESDVRGHDGSLTKRYGDHRDMMLLTLEQRIYDSLPAEFRTEARPSFDVARYLPGKYRGVPLFGYDRQEVTRILSPAFERWAQVIGVDYRVNAEFAEGEPFTWNFSACWDQQGEALPGHWRAIYRHFFDTDRPDLRPWEMLGFADMPDWWEEQYGPAPYTLGNSELWDDITEGRIARGDRAGVDAFYARPGVMAILPIDEDGELLDPIRAGIIAAAPVFQDAMAPWRFGDHGPVEEYWINTPEYRYALTLAGYLMKPARFVEACWDSRAQHLVHRDQWVLADGYRARDSGATVVHGETLPDGSRVRAWGIQQWISDLMAARGQSATLLGDAVRGLSVRLGYKVGGFTTADNLRVVADNFGLVPDEDVQVTLYRSPSVREEVYTGAIVEWTGAGWRVVGYNALDPNFTVMPGDPNGPKTVIATTAAIAPPISTWRPNTYYTVGVLIVFEGSFYAAIRGHTSGPLFEQSFWEARPGLSYPSANRVLNYRRSLGTVERIPYGTILPDVQAVADLLLGLARYQDDSGWRFDDAEEAAGGWARSVRQFLIWSSDVLTPGSFLALSPAGSHLRFETATGTLLPAERMFRGVYGLLDRAARPIDNRDTLVRRLDGELSFASTAGDLHAAQVSVGEVEHVLLFSNTTIFEDIIYAPLYDLRQPRLRIIGQRSRDWVGRYEAPGYVIVNGQIEPNFEKMVDDISTAFAIEKADNKTLRDYARHVTGYQSRGYLRDLFLSDTEQFEFYQGLIQQKGVPSVFGKLVRSHFVNQNRNLKFFDEWAIKVGEYGARSALARMSFRLDQSNIRRDPQFVVFRNGTAFGNDDWIEIVDTAQPSSLWIEPPRSSATVFPLRYDFAAAPGAMPTAGYARLSDVTGTAFDMAALATRYDDFREDGGFTDGSRWWVYNGPRNTWDIYRICAIPGRVVTLLTNDDDPNVQSARLVFDEPHGLSEADVGAYVVVGPDPAMEAIQGLRQITRLDVRGNWIETDASTLRGADFGPAGSPTQGPTVAIMRGTRFPDLTALNAAYSLPRAIGDLAYVDGAPPTQPWTVQRWGGSQWEQYRSQPHKVMSSRIASAVLYNLSTEIANGRLSPEPLVLDSLVIIDPVGGLIAGVADREISYKTEYDPAFYTGGFQSSTDIGWGEAQVGALWWDISAVRFMEAETDTMSLDPASQGDRLKAELQYRSEQWGRLAPGSTVRLYEWVASLLPPFEWAESQQGTPLTLEDGNIPCSEGQVYDTAQNRHRTVYYFWVEGRNTVPEDVPTRRIDAAAVARIIANPTNLNTPWLSPVAPNALLVGGISTYLDDVGSVLQVTTRQTESDGVVHQQWRLMRQGDERSLPDDALWIKLRDSLAGFDDRLRPVPRSAATSQQNGLLPSQSLFAEARTGMLNARRSFIGLANTILARTNLTDTRAASLSALRGETPISQYRIWVQAEASEPIQPLPSRRDPETGAGIWDREVTTVEERDALLFEPEVRTSARPFRVLINGLGNTIPQWSVYVLDMEAIGLLASWQGSDADLLARADDPPAPGVSGRGLFRLDRNFDDPDHTVRSIGQRDSLIPILTDGESVLVTEDGSAQTFWTVWQYNAAATPPFGTAPVVSQTYRLSDFWEYIDWYEADYAASDAPRVSYPTVVERDIAEGTNPSNLLVRIADDAGRWSWQAWADGVWLTVARQGGTIRFLPTLYDETRVPYGFGALTTSQIILRDGSWEMRFLADVLRYTLLTEMEVNELFFSMLHFVHAQQDQVNWAFKTSFLTVSGYREPLAQSAISTAENTNSLIAYIDEVKPYRVKMREFTRSLTTETDIAIGRATDFDKPPYRDEGVYRPLNFPEDAAILQTDPWSYWSDNYTKTGLIPGTPEFNPVRHMTIRLKFDRVTTRVNPRPIIGQQSFPYQGGEPVFAVLPRYSGMSVTAQVDNQSIPENAVTVDDSVIDAPVVRLSVPPIVGSTVVLTFREPRTAADRLAAFYSRRLPDGTIDESMQELDIDDLLNVGFQGTEYDAMTLANRGERDVDLDANGNPEVEAIGYGLRDPYAVARRPEEAVSVGGTVSLALNITDRPGNGLVPQGTRLYHTDDVTDDATVTLGLPVIAQGNGAVAVFRDGYRAEEGASKDFTVNLTAQTVTVKVVRAGTRTRRMAVHAFGPGATTTVLDRRFYRYTSGPATFTIPAEFVGDDVEALVSGNRLAANQYTVSGATVTLTSPPAANSDVILVFRTKNGAQPVRVEMRTQILPYAAGRTWTLAYPSDLNPAHEATIAELNGRRLVPPDTVHFHLDSYNRVITLRRPYAQANITLTMAGSAIPVRDGNASSSLAGAIADSQAGWKFVLFGNQIAALDNSVNGEVIVVGAAGHDYTVNQVGLFTLLASMQAGDVLSVTTFVNAAALKINTLVLDSGTSDYRILPPPRPDLAWITYDGLRIEAGEDYEFSNGLVIRPDLPATTDIYPGLGYDTAGFDTDGWDQGGTTIPNTIVATIFNGPAVREVGRWMVHMRRPSDSILSRVTDTPGAFTMAEEDIWAARLRPEFSGALAAPLGPLDATVSITVGSPAASAEMMAPDPFPVPDLANNQPGAVWIDRERIEYFDLQRSGAAVTLGQLRRATHGTSRGETRLVAAYVSDGSTASYLLNGTTALDRLEVRVAGRWLRPEVDYHATGETNRVRVTLPAAPLAGSPIVLARSAAQPTHAQGSLVYGAGRAEVDLNYVLNNGNTGTLGEPYDDYFFHTDDRGFTS